MRGRQAQFLMLALAICAVPAVVHAGEVDDGVWATLQGGTGEVLVMLADQADLAGTSFQPDRRDRARAVFAALTATAARSQAPVVALLESAGVEYRRYWIANLIWVRADARLIRQLADRDDVGRILANPRIRIPEDETRPVPAVTDDMRTIEWNLLQVGAPTVWATGNTGQGGVVGILDTGVDWDHPALIRQYRGWDGSSAEHDFNWHDATAAQTTEPDDPSGHGTRAMGVAVGDDGEGIQIGVAPGARWIAARCLDAAWGTPATFIECLEWMTAPYPIAGDPFDGDPTRSPDVILTCWSCLPDEGCAWDTLLPIMANVRAAGICVVSIAGGYGPQCSTIQYPPEIYDETFTVGTTDSADNIASFSSRGPVAADGSGRIKPDVCAPGVNVRSSTAGGAYVTTSGASVAAPHVAGLIALLVTANPQLAGQVDALEDLVADSAVPRSASQCGDIATVPNNVYGHGRIDAAAACAGALTVVEAIPAAPTLACVPNPFNPRTTVNFTLSIAGHVVVAIYDARGMAVARLIDESLPPDAQTVEWNGRDARGASMPSGTYFCRLTTADGTRTAKLQLVR